jgi:homoserine O-acetyltransferase
MAEPSSHLVLSSALELDDQSPLPGVRVAYRVWGEFDPERVVVLLHGLSHSHHALCEPLPGDWSPHGWARGLFGPGTPLEPKQFCLLCPNLLASPFGSTRPGEGLPTVTVADQARALKGLLDGLGIARAKAVVGFSLGGMVALQFAALFPESLAAVATVAGPATLEAAPRAALEEVSGSLLRDPELRPGDGRGSRRALVRARMAALRALHPRAWLDEDGNAFATEWRLEREADAFAGHFDAYGYMALLGCMTRARLSPALAWVETRSLVVAASTDELATPESMRDTWSTLCNAGSPSRYFELAGPAGHRQPYLDSGALAQALGEFLAAD